MGVGGCPKGGISIIFFKISVSRSMLFQVDGCGGGM